MSKGIVEGQKWLMQGLGISDPEMQKTISELLLDTPGGYNNLSREEKALLSMVLGWGEEDGTKTTTLLLALQFQRLSAALNALGAPLDPNNNDGQTDEGAMFDLAAIESRYMTKDHPTMVRRFSSQHALNCDLTFDLSVFPSGG